VRAEAARALGHLSHWPRGPELAALLEDSSWEVRRESGLALGSIGAPGRLLLRRARFSAYPFAADMAHQVLDLLEIQQLAAS
jgi:HEAT repeat protein